MRKLLVVAAAFLAGCSLFLGNEADESVSLGAPVRAGVEDEVAVSWSHTAVAGEPTKLLVAAAVRFPDGGAILLADGQLQGDPGCELDNGESDAGLVTVYLWIADVIPQDDRIDLEVAVDDLAVFAVVSTSITPRSTRASSFTDNRGNGAALSLAHESEVGDMIAGAFGWADSADVSFTGLTPLAVATGGEPPASSGVKLAVFATRVVSEDTAINPVASMLGRTWVACGATLSLE